MDPRKANETRNRWAIGVRTAAVVVALGALAAVWHPAKVASASHDATAASNDTAAASATAEMSAYFPARFPAPENAVEQPPTF